METCKEQQDKARKDNGCFMVVTRCFSILPANKQQSMRGAKCSKLQTSLKAK